MPHPSANEEGAFGLKNAGGSLGGIRVNAVAPGPIWTPLNPCGGASPQKLKNFGENIPMGRPGQPNEVAPTSLFLACEDAIYISGQVLRTIVNG